MSARGSTPRGRGFKDVSGSEKKISSSIAATATLNRNVYQVIIAGDAAEGYTCLASRHSSAPISTAEQEWWDMSLETRFAMKAGVSVLCGAVLKQSTW